MNLEVEHTKLSEKMEKYEQKFKTSAEKHQTKIDEFKKQIAQLTSEQVELKDVMKEVSLANQQLKVKAEEAEGEVRRLHEANLKSQMEASPLLAEVAAQQEAEDKFGGWEEDREDGWGSPEPEPEKSKPEAAILQEAAASDGWAGWGDEADDIKLDDDGLKNVEVKETEDGDQEAAGKNLVEREADIEDGWGDDSWGGFGEEEAVGPESGLADNLR